MAKRLNPKDIRAIKLGVILAVGIFLFWIGNDIYDYWKEAKASTTLLNNKLKLIDVDKVKHSGLMSIVPKFEMPVEEEEQKFLFQDKLTEQFKKAGIKNQPLQVASKKVSKLAGYQLLSMKCSANCRFTQVLDLLADMQDNPYLVGIEELRIRTDQKKPQEVEMDLTVSTLVK
ncbi:MAG: hypothetical protein JW837_16160 [Sedimentisphaerales bacterium]|nr:hypothetical protein [Sedimentisphaerales bacterium]